jgi:hypothetical protein
MQWSNAVVFLPFRPFTDSITSLALRCVAVCFIVSNGLFDQFLRSSGELCAICTFPVLMSWSARWWYQCCIIFPKRAGSYRLQYLLRLKLVPNGSVAFSLHSFVAVALGFFADKNGEGMWYSTWHVRLLEHLRYYICCIMVTWIFMLCIPHFCPSLTSMPAINRSRQLVLPI